MQVPHTDSQLLIVLRQVLRHPFGEGRHQHAFAVGRPPADFRQQVVDLTLDGPHLDRRIDQARRPDDLLDHDALSLGQLVGSGCGRDKDHLVDPAFPFLEVERPVVERRRQPEPIGHQHFFPRSIAVVHATNLRHRLVALVDNEERILGQVIEQRRRRLARRAPRQVSSVILDTVAVPDLANHLEVEHRSLMEALRLEELAFRLERRSVPPELGFDRLDGFLGPIARGDEMRLRIDGNLVVAAQRLARQRVERREPVDLVSEQLDPQPLLLVGQIHFNDVASHTKCAAPELVVVPLVLNLHELAEHLLPGDALPALERQQHAVIGLGRAEPVNARHARDNNHVAALEERPRRRQAHAVDFVVDRRLFFDVRVGRRHVRLGLVVVVIADEILDGILGKEPAKFLIQLSGERFVVHHHQRRTVHAGNGLRHRERLARAGDAEQHLMGVAALQPVEELPDRARLIAGKLEIGYEVETIVERGHENCKSYHRARGK